MVKSDLKVKTRIGKICYTNCLPYYHQLESEGGDYYESFPARINLAMRHEKIDIAPVSSLEYLNHQRKYFILPEFAIGSRDFSGSVLLLSKEKIENLNGKTIALTRESASSSALLRVLLKFKYKFDNKFTAMHSEPDRMLEKAPAALVIGDSALFYQPKDFVYKYDLSELWWNWTGKPFCFALWVVRRDFAEEYPEEVSVFSRRLKKSRDRNLMDLETLVKDALGLTFLDKRFPKVFGYLFNLSYTLDPEMREGLELFYRLANRLRLSPRPKNLEFFNL